MAKIGRVCKHCLGKRHHGLSEKAIRNCGLLKAVRHERDQKRANRKAVIKKGRKWTKEPTVSGRAWSEVNGSR